MKVFLIIFDISMAVIMFFVGIVFYKSQGKAANLLTGYNMRPAEVRKKYDEKEMCIIYGKRMMFMSLPFVLGAMIDIFYTGTGCFISWILWAVLFILLLVDRHKREK